MLRKLLLLASLFSFPAHALGPDPRQDWQSADSAHFRINYLPAQRAQAEHAAQIAERAYARLSRQLHWEMDGKTEVVLLDAFDIANGYSTPLPFNKTALYLIPPDQSELLDNSDWMELLITHELTHSVHLDKVRGLPLTLRHIIGRDPLLFPNLFQPGWAIEGIATYNESVPEEGRGRLFSPGYEALLRVQQQRGFLSLSEINADGRALPASKQYLYGAYFYDFLARKYGGDAAYRYIDAYSDNLLPRVYSNPEELTGKTMDVLWDEFLADLDRGVNERSATIKAAPRADGAPLLPARFKISSLAPAPDGVLAVVDDGWLGTELLHIDVLGKTDKLADVKGGARLDLHADGRLLLEQPEICDNYNFYYDLYLWDKQSGMRRLSQCQRYRRAVWAGQQIAALKFEGGNASLDILQLRDGGAQKVRTLYTADDGIAAIDLAASADGQRIALVIKQNSRWQVLEFSGDFAAARVLFESDAPLHELRYARDGSGLEFIAAHGHVSNLWSFAFGSGELVRLSHTYTGLTLHGGINRDGSVVVGALAAEGTELRRLAAVTEHSRIAARSGGNIMQNGNTGADKPAALGAADSYLALRSLYPRSWLPLSYADSGTRAYGINVFGSDAMGWHNYSLNAMWETQRGEMLGSFDYNYLDQHFFFFSRNVWTRLLADDGSAAIYDRDTSAQWVSTLRWLQSGRRLYLGIGAAQQSTERVYRTGYSYRPKMERVTATFAKYDTRETNWYASGYNRGALASLLYESYRPFGGDYDGHIVRLDGQGIWPLGKQTLSARWSEVRAAGSTEPFQLGGAFEPGLTQVPYLNQRYLPLRGYGGSETQLSGQNARGVSLEYAAPLADIDRHGMAPPLGLNRLAAAAFFDAGSAWDNGAAPAKLYRGIGVELHGEIKLVYQFMLPLRLGFAHPLDLGGSDRIYLQLGQTF